MNAITAPRLVHTPRHIAGRALLAAISGRLWYHRLSTPVLEQLRGAALQAAAIAAVAGVQPTASDKIRGT